MDALEADGLIERKARIQIGRTRRLDRSGGVRSGLRRQFRASEKDEKQ
jgi:hypothetical protein